MRASTGARGARTAPAALAQRRTRRCQRVAIAGTKGNDCRLMGRLECRQRAERRADVAARNRGRSLHFSARCGCRGKRADHAFAHRRSNRPAGRHDPADPGPHSARSLQDIHPGRARPSGDRSAGGALGAGRALPRHRSLGRGAVALRPVHTRHLAHRARPRPAAHRATDAVAAWGCRRHGAPPTGPGSRTCIAAGVR